MSTNPNAPNMDQRLEALTHSVELTAQTQLQTEKELKRLSRDVRRFTRTAQLILLDHEARLREIEGAPSDDEEDDEE